MALDQNYRWPTKLRRYGIEDPFLKILGSKYESEIPWQVQVRDEKSLVEYVRSCMLPRLLARATFPPQVGVKHLYITESDVDLDAALTSDQELDSIELAVIELIRSEDGEDEARKALAAVVNDRKKRAFQAWTALLEEEYPDCPAFNLLLLRPLFDLSGHRTRRSLVPSDKDTIEWLFRRIVRGKITPSENVARLYCWKLGSGSQTIPTNGWQYVPSGPAHTVQLSAASRGSGWCVADPVWASRYLAHSSFFILRHDSKPIVALRVERDGRVCECQGRENWSPLEWFIDIYLFLKTQGLTLWHRYNELAKAVTNAGDLAVKSDDWWRDRIRFWPFAALMAPCDVSERLREEIRAMVPNYLGWPTFQALATQAGLQFDTNEWAKMIAFQPARYNDCPAELRQTDEFRQACTRGWVERAEDDELTLADLKSIPEFVKCDEEFRRALMRNFPADVRERMRRNPATYAERRGRLSLHEVFPLEEDEPRDLAIERLVNILLNNEDGNYSEEKFPLQLRKRDDFISITERVWWEAMQLHPPLWFALPEELAARDNFKAVETIRGKVNCASWRDKVLKTPWLLTQQKGVPKTLRLHHQILEAYRDAWCRFLRATPWRIWVKRGLYRRVYMSYALLGDKRVSAALQMGWKDHLSHIEKAWNKASDRMKNVPALQVSVVRTIAYSGRRFRTAGEREVCLDIARRLVSSEALEARYRSLYNEMRSFLRH